MSEDNKNERFGQEERRVEKVRRIDGLTVRKKGMASVGNGTPVTK